jgi:circadian clock protein KaiB
MTEKISLKLYVTGQTYRSEMAIRNLEQIEAALGESCETTVIDVLEQPNLAEADRILATPTLIRYLPPPSRRVIGDLSDQDKVMFGLGLGRLTPPAYTTGGAA